MFYAMFQRQTHSRRCSG